MIYIVSWQIYNCYSNSRVKCTFRETHILVSMYKTCITHDKMKQKWNTDLQRINHIRKISEVVFRGSIASTKSERF